MAWKSYVEPAEADTLTRLHEMAKDSLEIRSIIAWFEGEEDPRLVEIPSAHYQDAMMAKHPRDAKSASVLCAEGLCERLSELVEPEIRARLQLLSRAVEEVSRKLSEGLSEDRARILSKTLKSLARGKSVSPEEILNEVSRGSVKRIVKKILALALEEKSLASADFTEILLKTLSTSSE